LSNGGEAIGLFATDGVTPLSTVVYGRQLQNISEGRFPDGDTNSVSAMTNWTPRAPNTLAGLGEVRILTVTFDATSLVTLSWNSIPRRTYQVQFKDDLAAALWTNLGPPIPAMGPTTTCTDTIPPEVTSRFYRVLLNQ
jgi:hypothetical protein